MNPEISIVVPVYNAEAFIQETIASVQKQSFQNWELIFVNDNSTDQSVQRIKEVWEERMVLLENPKPGSAARARNYGTEHARGRYLAFLDADDLWHPEKLARTLDFMKLRDAAFVFTSYEFGDEAAKGTGKIVHVPERLSYQEALGRTVIFTSTVMLDLHKLEKSKVQMPEVKSEDTACWWSILRQGYCAYGLDTNLVTYRRAGKSLSSNKFEAIKRMWNLLKMQPNLSLWKRCQCFVCWAFGAVARRI